MRIIRHKVRGIVTGNGFRDLMNSIGLPLREFEFRCHCGCEFIVDEEETINLSWEEIKKPQIGEHQSIAFVRCPECNRQLKKFPIE